MKIIFFTPKETKYHILKIKLLKEYSQNYENSPWYIVFNYNIQVFDENKIKTKNLSTKHNPRKTIVASNKRYEYMQINNFMISIKGEIEKDVISTYIKCYNIPMLWRKFFLNIANNREYIINYCNRPLHKSDRLLREWYLNENPNENGMRAFDDNLDNYYIVFG